MSSAEYTGPGEAMSSWCEVDVQAMRHNTALLRQRLRPGALLGVVVKSNAYGHGMLICAREFLAAGADWLVVNSVGEASRLREAGIAAPLYICTTVPPGLAGLVAQTRARVVLCDGQTARALAQAGRQSGEEVRVHLKVETGMHRQGVSLAEALELAQKVQKLEGICLEGLTTHYADSDDTVDHGFARGQLQLLEEAHQAFQEKGIPVPLVHSANSAATLLWPETHGGLVRAGLSAYGLWPSREARATAQDRGEPELRPALTWRARIVQVKEVPAGGFVGYGRTFRAAWPMRVAILPVGYYEGYDRRLSNVAYVLVQGVRAPVRGRVCMNMTMVEVTHIPGVEAGAVATLLGRDGDEEVSADQWAAWMGGINYEVVTRINPEQPRLVRQEDGKVCVETIF